MDGSPGFEGPRMPWPRWTPALTSPAEISDIYGSAEVAILALNSQKGETVSPEAGSQSLLVFPAFPAFPRPHAWRLDLLPGRSVWPPGHFAALHCGSLTPGPLAGSLASERPSCFSPRLSCRPSDRLCSLSCVWAKTGGATVKDLLTLTPETENLLDMILVIIVPSCLDVFALGKKLL